jgi:hypothetical protein
VFLHCLNFCYWLLDVRELLTSVYVACASTCIALGLQTAVQAWGVCNTVLRSLLYGYARCCSPCLQLGPVTQRLVLHRTTVESCSHCQKHLGLAHAPAHLHVQCRYFLRMLNTIWQCCVLTAVAFATCVPSSRWLARAPPWLLGVSTCRSI